MKIFCDRILSFRQVKRVNNTNKGRSFILLFQITITVPPVTHTTTNITAFFGFRRCSFGMFSPWNVTMLHPTAMFMMMCYSILLMFHWTVSRCSFSPPVQVISLLHFRHIFFMAVILTTGQFIFSWNTIRVLLLFRSASSFHSWSPLLSSV